MWMTGVRCKNRHQIRDSGYEIGDYPSHYVERDLVPTEVGTDRLRIPLQPRSPRGEATGPMACKAEGGQIVRPDGSRDGRIGNYERFISEKPRLLNTLATTSEVLPLQRAALSGFSGVD